MPEVSTQYKKIFRKLNIEPAMLLLQSEFLYTTSDKEIANGKLRSGVKLLNTNTVYVNNK